LDERENILKKEFGGSIIIDYSNDFEKDIDWINNLNTLIQKYCNKEDNINFL
jgi:hypothetical protein